MDSASQKPRLLIFVIAYFAEDTLRSVLERIPRDVFDCYYCEVLVVDDASHDRTFEVGRTYALHHPEIPMTVLRNGYNQGYGGNQKVGYAYALSQNFDFVAMLHGDAQYAPEELPRLVAQLRDSDAGAVFGSRMMTRFGALKGGMPLYKYVGNKILTAVQNVLLGTNLSEFHSGYRIYSIRALRRIKFQLNSNGFHFDTEVIIQLLNAQERIIELPIPTYYGNEICRVNGMKYALDVILATLQNVAHRVGLLYQRRFDPVSESNEHYTLKCGYASSHQWALEAVPNGARALDIGAGPGGIAEALVAKGCDVATVDQFPCAHGHDNVTRYTQDLNAPLMFRIDDYDYLLLLDVIEHLRDPEMFLDALRKQFTFTPKTLVLSTPNIAFAVQRLMLLFGQFNYGRAGILDRTHTRLFTFRSLDRLLRDAGFKVKVARGVPAPFPKAFGRNAISLWLVKLNEMAIKISKTLFSYQIFVIAESTPDMEFVLRDSKNRSLVAYDMRDATRHECRRQIQTQSAELVARSGDASDSRCSRSL